MRNHSVIPSSIIVALERETGEIARPASDRDRVLGSLGRLGLLANDEVREFFLRYKLAGILSCRSDELLDIASPTTQIEQTTLWARDIYGLADDLIALTDGEGDGFILLSIADGAVFDVGVDELEDIEQGLKKPRWASFFDLMAWYLGVELDD